MSDSERASSDHLAHIASSLHNALNDPNALKSDVQVAEARKLASDLNALLSGVSRARSSPNKSSVDSNTVQLDGASLSPDILYRLSRGNIKLELTEDAWERVRTGRRVVDNIVEKGEVVYGINTGFGLFSNVIISPGQLGDLQENLIRSHASGIGDPLSPERTRMLLALRANVLSKGHSGIRECTLRKILAAFNNDCLSVIPAKGTVGASGDLAPLSHLALGLLGEGYMWNLKSSPPQPNIKANVLLSQKGLEPIELTAKEGLAMINGTQLIASLGAEATVRARNAARCADIICALTLEVLKVRPHTGQQLVAARLRALLRPNTPSELFNSHQYEGRVQDIRFHNSFQI